MGRGGKRGFPCHHVLQAELLAHCDSYSSTHHLIIVTRSFLNPPTFVLSEGKIHWPSSFAVLK